MVLGSVAPSRRARELKRHEDQIENKLEPVAPSRRARELKQLSQHTPNGYAGRALTQGA